MFKRDDIVTESGDLGLILQAGRVTYDVVWIGGSTSRYHYSTGRDVKLATKRDLDGQESTVEHLRQEATAAREERRQGAGIKRGQVSPNR